MQSKQFRCLKLTFKVPHSGVDTVSLPIWGTVL